MIDYLKRLKEQFEKPDSSGEFAEEAKFLLNHPIMVTAFERLENDIISQFLNSSVQDVETREEIHREHKALQSLKSRLEGFIHLSLINRSIDE